MIQISQPQIGKEEIKAAEEVLLSGRLAQGAKVAEFEERFAAYVGASYGVAVGNGTEALHLALLSRGVRPGEKVITTPFSFAATATAILMCGARPVFVDVEEATGNMDPYLLHATMVKHGPTIGACIPVHLYGHPAEMRRISAYCTEDAPYMHIPIIWDACQAHGARGVDEEWDNFPVGDEIIGGRLSASCWSFYATKNMTTGGEGGMITTNDEGEADLLRGLRNHGQGGQYNYVNLGYNYRMTEIQAAIGLAQLDKLPTFQARRQYNAAYLTEGLAGLPMIILPTVRAGTTHAWHQYTIRLPWDGERTSPRDLLRMYLASEDVGARVYYPTPLHKSELFQARGYGLESYPMAERLSREVLSLPVHPGLTDKDLDRIVHLVRTWVEARA